MNNHIDISSDASISDRQGIFILNKPFVLTRDKTLVNGMPYMYIEGNRTTAVRLLKAWQEDDVIYLNLQELKSQKTFTLSWNLDYEGDYYLWTLADLPTLMKPIK